jgi:predicted PurR-regulated permease PerM
MREEDISAKTLWQVPLFRDAVYLAALFLSIWAIISYWRIFFPPAVSLLLAYVFNDWINHIERKYILTRKKISFLIVITFSVFVLAFFVWLGPLVTSQSQKLIAELPIYIESISKKFGLNIQDLIPGNIEDMKMGTLLSSVGEALQSTGKLWTLIRDAFTDATYILFYLILIPIYWYYLMVNFEKIHWRPSWALARNSFGGLHKNLYLRNSVTKA